MRFRLTERVNPFSTLTYSDIDELCKRINEKYNAYSGNCGTFALALCRVFHNQFDCELAVFMDSDIVFTKAEEIGVTFNDNVPIEWVDKNITPQTIIDNEFDVYHIVCCLGDELFDGEGSTQLSNVNDICRYEYNDKYPLILEFEYSTDSDGLLNRMIELNTKFTYSTDEFESAIKSELNSIIKEKENHNEI